MKEFCILLFSQHGWTQVVLRNSLEKRESAQNNLFKISGFDWNFKSSLYRVSFYWLLEHKPYTGASKLWLQLRFEAGKRQSCKSASSNQDLRSAIIASCKKIVRSFYLAACYTLIIIHIFSYTKRKYCWLATLAGHKVAWHSREMEVASDLSIYTIGDL